MNKTLPYLLATVIIILSTTISISCAKNERSKIQQDLSTLKCLNSLDDPREDFQDYEVLNIINLETTAECLISQIKQIEIVDSLIFILDANRQLYLFNDKGQFLTQIGKKGEAPSEYINLNTFYIDKDEKTVILIDDYKSNLIKYNLEGEYINTTKAPLELIRRSNYAQLVNKENLLLYKMMNMEDNMAYSLLDVHHLTSQGDFFSYAPIKVDNYIYSFSSHPISKLNNRLNVILPLCDTIYTLEDNTFKPLYHIETSPSATSKYQLKEKESYIEGIRRLNKNGDFTGFTAIYENNNSLILEYLHGGVIVGFFLFDEIKRNGNCYLYSSTADIKKIPFFKIVGSTDQYLIGTQSPAFLLQSSIDINTNDQINSKFDNIVKNIKYDDNPVLFFYQIKNEEE